MGSQVCIPGLFFAYILLSELKALSQQHLSDPKT